MFPGCRDLLGWIREKDTRIVLGRNSKDEIEDEIEDKGLRMRMRMRMEDKG